MLLMARKMMARDAAACGLISEVLPKQRLMSEVRACAPACRPPPSGLHSFPGANKLYDSCVFGDGGCRYDEGCTKC